MTIVNFLYKGKLNTFEDLDISIDSCDEIILQEIADNLDISSTSLDGFIVTKDIEKDTIVVHPSASFGKE